MAIERPEWKMKNLQTEIWCLVYPVKYYLQMWEGRKAPQTLWKLVKSLCDFQEKFYF